MKQIATALLKAQSEMSNQKKEQQILFLNLNMRT